MLLGLFRRSFKACDYWIVKAWQRIRLGWLQLINPGLIVGRGVSIESGALLKVVRGGSMIIGEQTKIGPGALLIAEGRLNIGCDGYVGKDSIIVANDRISIGNDALIASNVVIRDHDHGTQPGTAFRLQPQLIKAVTIGDNVWVGANACILKGVSIGSDSIVGAGAIVTRDVPAQSVAMGSPARHRPRKLPEASA